MHCDLKLWFLFSHGKEGLQVSKFISQVCHLVVDANVDVSILMSELK